MQNAGFLLDELKPEGRLCSLGCLSAELWSYFFLFCEDILDLKIPTTEMLPGKMQVDVSTVMINVKS